MDTDEKVAKHIDLVQGVITRMAGNSFLLKGWSVTLVAGLLAVAASGGNWVYAALGLFPSLSFWLLDAYYLQQERLFRLLHDEIRAGRYEAEPYSMDTKKVAGKVSGMCATACSLTVLWLHGIVVLVVLFVSFVLWLQQ